MDNIPFCIAYPRIDFFQPGACMLGISRIVFNNGFVFEIFLDEWCITNGNGVANSCKAYLEKIQENLARFDKTIAQGLKDFINSIPDFANGKSSVNSLRKWTAKSGCEENNDCIDIDKSTKQIFQVKKETQMSP